MAQPKALPPISCSEEERLELLGYAAAQRRDFAVWAREALLAAARLQSRDPPLFSEDERAHVERTAKSCNLAVPAFIRRATIAAVRRVGSRG